MRITKVSIVIITALFLIFSSTVGVYADQFWNLYQLGEAKKSSGDILGAIKAWKDIVNLYDGDTSRDAVIRTAVYWTNIAEAYNNMGWYGEAQQAYKNVETAWNSIGEKDSAWGPNRIATRLNTDLKVYANVPTEQKTGLSKFEPATGIYFGAPFDKDSKIGDDITKVPEVYGKNHTAYLMYVRWGDPIQSWTAQQAKDMGAALQIAWEPPADMTKVDYNDVYDFAQKLKELDMPIFLRFASEMNEPTNPWSQNTPEVYKKTFKMVADIMHKEAPNVAMVWAPLYVPTDTIQDFYPGDDAVDWIGVDAYTDRYYIGDPTTKSLIEDLYYQGYYANPLDRFQYIYDTYSSKKPIFIAETGVQNFAINTGEDFSDWAANNIKRLYGYIPMVYPRIKAIFYFNVDSSLVPGLGLKQNYSLSRSQKVMDVYKKMIQNPYYLSKVGQNSTFSYKPLEELNWDKNKQIELSTYAKIMDPFIERVEYWVDGKKLSTQKNIPFSTTLDLSKHSMGKHILRVDAFDSKERLNARREYTVNISTDNISFTAGKVLYVPRHIVLNDTNHWAKDQIEKLVSLWSVDGYDNGTFQPEEAITRAEFYKVLSTSLGMGLQVNSNNINDVPADHWAKGLLEGGVQLGIIDMNDYKNGFNADQPITREEMAEWAIRALNGGKQAEISNTLFIDDNKILTQYKGYIKDAYSDGIIDGFPDKSFRPSETATRAQAAAIIVRAIEYQNKNN